MTRLAQPTPGPLGIYYDRWQALDQLIAGTINALRQKKFQRKATILYLLRSLREYARGQFRFFYVGFHPDGAVRSATDPVLQPVADLPAEDILRAILEQIAHDLDLIQRAANQRILEDDNGNDTLAKADCLAWQALQKAIQYNVIDQPATVLTYFEKSAAFYSIPYAKVALIAVPLTCAARVDHRDFLAIPHEVGHYVYRHPELTTRHDLKRLRHSKKIPPEYREWISDIFEEMCADIYSCLVAGPVMAVDFESLELANSQEDFRSYDGQHPNPVIRPRLFCEVLASPKIKDFVDGDWQTIAGKLDAGWGKLLGERKATDFVTRQTQTTGQRTIITEVPHSLQAGINATALPAQRAHHQAGSAPGYGSFGDVVYDVVNAMLKKLEAYVQAQHLGDNKGILAGWAGKIETTTEPNQLLGLFEGQLAALLSPLQEKSFDLDRPLPPVKPWLQWAQEQNPKLGLGPAWTPAKKIPAGKPKKPDQMRPGTWGYMLYANGWTTGGPSGNEHGYPID